MIYSIPLNLPKLLLKGLMPFFLSFLNNITLKFAVMLLLLSRFSHVRLCVTL